MQKKKTTRRKAKKKAKGKQGPQPRREVGLRKTKTKKKKRGKGSPGAASKMTPKKAGLFISKLCETGNVKASAGFAGMSPTMVYRHKKKNKDFAAAWDEAIEIAVDCALEPEAVRRATEGWEEPLHFKGEHTGDTIRKFSDTLLIFLLKGAKPEKYRERFDVHGQHKVETEATVVFYPSNGREGEPPNEGGTRGGS